MHLQVVNTGCGDNDFFLVGAAALDGQRKLGLRAASRDLRILGMTAETEKKMSPNPRRVERIAVGLTVRLEGGTEADQNWLREEALACPVALSLHPDLRQDIRIEFA